LNILVEEQTILNLLERLGVHCKRYEHPPVFTVEEAEQYDVELPGAVHCKNLFLRNKKGDRHYLAVLAVTTQIHLKELAEQIGSSALSFASAQRLEHYLGVTAGAVGPFGLVNDREKAVTVLLDHTLTGADWVGFHPNVNTSTLMIPAQGLDAYLKWCGNMVIVI
jgi:Ala-tRNA(Pro) deacylase